MRTTLTVLSIAAALLLAPLTLNLANKAIQGKVTEEVSKIVNTQAGLPPSADALAAPAVDEAQAIKKVIKLEAQNMVVLKGPVTETSVAKAMKELQAASRAVSKNTPIYLVLDTPGGSIMDGMDLIDFAKALPQKVNTVTLFAASMGFQIAQNLDTRYIVRDGTLMSHRARVEGLGGQVKGELETRYKNVRRAVDYLDYVAASRMSMKTPDYEKMIFNEYWVYGFDAVKDKAADEQVLLSCGDSLNGTYSEEFQTLFGAVKVTFSKCPLIKAPESIEMGNIKLEDREKVETAMRMSLTDQKTFVDEYITTSRFSEIFR